MGRPDAGQLLRLKRFSRAARVTASAPFGDVSNWSPTARQAHVLIGVEYVEFTLPTVCGLPFPETLVHCDDIES